jgi:hypothetical protein
MHPVAGVVPQWTYCDRAATGLTQKKAVRRVCRSGPASEDPLFCLAINQPRDRSQRGLLEDNTGKL